MFIVCLTGVAVAGPLDEMRSNCDSGADSLACMKFKVASFLDGVFTQDNFRLFGGEVEIRSNGARSARSNGQNARSADGADDTLMAAVEQYVESHDVTFNVPAAGAKVTVSPKNLENDEMTVSIKLAPEARSAVEGNRVTQPQNIRNLYDKCDLYFPARKSKLKKILVPIMVFVLLKAMTLIPLALGVLGLKAFNALQLSFFSFVASIALAIFQLCKKVSCLDEKTLI